MYMNTAPRPRPALLYVLRGQQRRAALPSLYGRSRGLGGSVTINTPAGPYQLPDLPTYTDQVFTRPSILAPSFDAATRRAEMIAFLNDWCGLNSGIACAAFSVASVVDTAIKKILAARSTGSACSGGYHYDSGAGRCVEVEHVRAYETTYSFNTPDNPADPQSYAQYPVGVTQASAPAPVPPTYTSTPASGRRRRRSAPAFAPAAPVAASSVGGSVASALSQNINVLGVDIPMWGAVAAGFGALWLLGGKR